MSVEIKYDQNGFMLRIGVSGPVSYDEFTSTMEIILNSRDYPPNINILWDLRKADLSQVNYDFWENIIRYRRQFPQRNNCRSAMIVDSDYQYGITRMFQNQAGDRIPQEFMVFRDLKEGEAWLLASKENSGLNQLQKYNEVFNMS